MKIDTIQAFYEGMPKYNRNGKTEKSKSKMKSALKSTLENVTWSANCHNVELGIDSSQMDVNDCEFPQCLIRDFCFILSY